MNTDQKTAELNPAQEQEESTHPGDWQYIKIAIYLALLTALEVFTYFRSIHELGNEWLYIVLTVIMVLKFIYVASWFMHLKFDNSVFSKIFIMGVSFALVVYMCMLTSFEIWA